MSLNTLPTILVTAKTQAAAVKLISEIIEENKDLEENKDPEQIKEEGEYKWLIQNKYYTAQVQLQPLGDDQSAPTDDVEAHVIALGIGEGLLEVEARAARVPSTLLLATVEAEEVTPALAEWAARSLAEVVPLHISPTEPMEISEPFGEESGVRRLREALHTHIWPNMRRRGTVTSLDEDLDPNAEHQNADDEVERAERFAAALGALGPASRHVASLSGAERLAAAEALVAEFALALGVPLDDL